MAARRRLCCWMLLLLAVAGQLLVMISLRQHRLLTDHSTGADDGSGSSVHVASVLGDSAVPDTVPDEAAGREVDLDDRPPHLVIILSSSPRSGSSLLGEILSTSLNTSYFFEPFYYYVKNNRSVARMPAEDVQQVLRHLLTCQLNQAAVLRQAKYRRFIWRPAEKPRLTPSTAIIARQCAASSTRVVKLVRTRLLQVLPLLEDVELGPRLRLVHLVRDPRGTLNSQLHANTVWNKLSSNLSGYCDGLRADLAAARPLSDPRYLRVRYERLAQQPRQLAEELYRGLRLPQPATLRAYFDRHMNSSQPVERQPPRRTGSKGLTWRGPAPPAARHVELEQRHARVLSRRAVAKSQLSRPRSQLELLKLRKQQSIARKKAKLTYFSTYRGPDFDPQHWRKELKPEVLHQLERHCADVIAELEAEMARPTAGAAVQHR